MVQPWNVNAFLTLHSFMSNDEILDGVHQGMSDVQLSSNIGRWQNHHVSVLPGDLRERLWSLLVELALGPPLVPSGLDELGIVGAWERLFVIPFELNGLLQSHGAHIHLLKLLLIFLLRFSFLFLVLFDEFLVYEFQ